MNRRTPSPQKERPPTRDVNAAERASLALKLRASKAKYAEIARQCGYASAGAAHRAVQRELDRTVVTNVEELRREELETLDLLQKEAMKLFLDPNNRGRLFAADRILAVMERRARLMALDQQQQNGLTVGAGLVIVREAPPGLLPQPAVSPQEGGQPA